MSQTTPTPAPAPRPALDYADLGGNESLLWRILKSRETGVFAALLLLVIIMSILRPYSFLSATNLFNLTRQISFTAVVAIGVLFVILTGGVDLSLGSTVGLTGFVAGWAVSIALPDKYHGLQNFLHNPLTAVAIGILTGALVGAFNGAIVSYIGVTSFIVTLGMLTIGRSIIYLMNRGQNILDVPPVFSTVANASVSVNDALGLLHWGTHRLHIPLRPLNVGFPVPLLILFAIAIGAHIVLSYTVFGRRIYAIGGNEEATRLSGINVRSVKFFTYVICSALCAVTGLLFVGRFNSAVANAGVGLELDAIAAAVIGGTSLMGGQGSVLGVLIGASIMGLVTNAITLLGIPAEAQGTIIGGIIVAAAILDVVRSKRGA
jgi:ribose/xylose/arabinose/galactoside ABC-type transport system permease subunit